MTPDEILEFMKTINSYLASIERELDCMTKDIEELNNKLDILRAAREEKEEPISFA